MKRNNGDQSLIQKMEKLLREATSIISLVGAVLGLYVFTKGRLVQMIAATGMVLPRIIRRFETSGMKDQLERILRELTGPDINRAIEDEARRIQQPGPKSAAATKCLEQHPFAQICAQQFDIEPEEIVMDFLDKKGIDFADVQDITCRRVDSFGPGVIRECNGAPGESWHCTVTIRQRGSTRQRVASLFRCLCCRADGTTAYEWTEPHWSPGG